MIYYESINNTDLICSDGYDIMFKQQYFISYFLGEVMLQNIRLKDTCILYVFIRSDVRSSSNNTSLATPPPIAYKYNKNKNLIFWYKPLELPTDFTLYFP